MGSGFTGACVIYQFEKGKKNLNQMLRNINSYKVKKIWYIMLVVELTMLRFHSKLEVLPMLDGFKRSYFSF